MYAIHLQCISELKHSKFHPTILYSSYWGTNSNHDLDSRSEHKLAVQFEV